MRKVKEFFYCIHDTPFLFYVKREKSKETFAFSLHIRKTEYNYYTFFFVLRQETKLPKKKNAAVRSRPGAMKVRCPSLYSYMRIFPEMQRNLQESCDLFFSECKIFAQKQKAARHGGRPCMSNVCYPTVRLTSFRTAFFICPLSSVKPASAAAA